MLKSLNLDEVKFLVQKQLETMFAIMNKFVFRIALPYKQTITK